VVDVQEAVLHDGTARDGLLSSIKKFMPVRVSVEEPVDGEFEGRVPVTTGESYVKRAAELPTRLSRAKLTRAFVPPPTRTVHTIVVELTHTEDAQLDSPTFAVGDRLVVPKLWPDMVIAEEPVGAPFCGLMEVSTGESYVTAARSVAVESLMTTLTVFTEPVPSSGLHVTAVPEVHADVPQTVAAKKIDAVRSRKPKLVPAKVIVSAPPAVGTFTVAIRVTIGESNVNPALMVPTVLDTVSRAMWLSPPPLADRQVTLEEVIHEVEAHTDTPISTVVERSVLPKLSPVKLSRVEPETTPFAGARAVSTGASNGNATPNEPIEFKTLTATLCWLPEPGLVVHVRLLSVVHEAVAQAAPPVKPVSVLSMDPKFRPETTTAWFALRGPLIRVVNVTTGALYVKASRAVETRDWIVNDKDCAPLFTPAAKQATELVVIQETVLQPEAEPVIETLAVWSRVAKFKPARVILPVAVAGKFGDRMAVRTGESNENVTACPVAETAKTRTDVGRATPEDAAGLQRRAVFDCHDVDEQNVAAMAAEGVRSTIAKLTPDIVSEVPLESGAFPDCRPVMTGPSYENAATSDPAPSTLATSCAPRPAPKPGEDVQTLEVVEIHCDAEQLDDPSRAVVE